ncbi:MAG: sigma-54-dependent Fis family transcriptional regulator [candidate division WOR-3 bacterium]|nr:MAG: sigma-54-dependent Fis family transcriptional regulator [candidate division WOR-3 bacterium]
MAAHSKSDRPKVLVVCGSRSEFRKLTACVRGYDGGRLGREFDFIHIDCYGSLRNWYRRNLGHFVALIVQHVSFAGAKDERKLVGHSGLKAPVPKGFDITALQGFLIYANLRQNNLDRIAPALFVPEQDGLLAARRYANYVVYPGWGSCNFAPDEGNDEERCHGIASEIDTHALRPLTDNQRRTWREKHHMVIGRSRRMANLAHEIARIGPSDALVLLLGRPGVGKELVANALHRFSHRYSDKDPDRSYPLNLNIAVIDQNLIEDELFGHEKGAFTGATSFRKGIFETAGDSTVFLDEIGDITQEIQLKLLRTIEYRLIKRLGSSKEVPVSMRIVAATNRSVEDLQERFRADFYSRLVQHCVPVPSLIDRWSGEAPGIAEQDLREMFDFVVEEMNRRPRHTRRLGIQTTAVKFVRQLVDEYIAGTNTVFNGNMRTLRNIIERAYERAQYDGSDEIKLGHLISTLGVVSFMDGNKQADRRPSLEGLVGSLDLRAIEKRAITEALSRCGNNQTKAAGILGIHRDTLRRKISEHQL